MDWNREIENQPMYIIPFLYPDLDHADVAAAPGPAPAQHQPHRAAPQHPRQSGEVGVNVRLNVLPPQPREVLAQPPGGK